MRKPFAAVSLRYYGFEPETEVVDRTDPFKHRRRFDSVSRAIAEANGELFEPLFPETQRP